MILLIALVLIAILVIRPKDLLTKIFRVEEIELLHRRNRKEAADHYTVKDWSRKALWRIFGYGFLIWSLTPIVLSPFTGLSTAASLAVTFAAIWFAFSLRLFAKYRATTVPLYLALARVSGSRWDVLDSPMKWVRVWSDEIRIRLPRDQHTTPVMVKQIQDLVTSRMRGQWTMKADLPGFLISFSVSRPVPVSVVTMDESVKSDAVPTQSSASDTIPVLVIEGDEDNGPW